MSVQIRGRNVVAFRAASRNSEEEDAPLLASTTDELPEAFATRGYDFGEPSDGPDMPIVGEDPPEDKYNLAYIAFFVQGLGGLLPWNAFITATAYLASRLDGSSFASNFENYFSFSFQVTNLSFLFLASRFQQRFSLKSRIVVPLITQFLLFLFTTIIVKVHMDQNVFFALTMVTVIISGGATAFYVSGVIGLASLMPFRYLQATMGGQGLGGLIVAILNIITLAAGGSDVDLSAFMFFLCSLVALVICLVSYFYMPHLPVIAFHMAAHDEHKRKMRRASFQPSAASLYQLFRKIAPTFFEVLFTFFVTLSLFPAISASVDSQYHSKYGKHYYTAVFCFLLFNASDLLGRMLAGWKQWPASHQLRLLKYPVLIRGVFILLFPMLNVQLGTAENPGSYWLPRILDKDVFAYLLMLLMGASNGYFGTLCMMFGPTVVSPDETEGAGSLMAIGLNIGIFSGTVFSFILRAILCTCNPFITPSSHANSTMSAIGPGF